MRVLAGLLLLGACTAAPRIEIPENYQHCAPAVAIPAGIPRVRTPAAIGQLEIRVELAREAERRRGDDCEQRLKDLNAWIVEHFAQLIAK